MKKISICLCRRIAVHRCEQVQGVVIHILSRREEKYFEAHSGKFSANTVCLSQVKWLEDAGPGFDDKLYQADNFWSGQ